MAIKAVLSHKGMAFPYIQDLKKLLEPLQASWIGVPARVALASGLSRYAVLGRYLGLARPVSKGQYRWALGTAETVLRWAEGTILAGGSVAEG